MSARTQLELYGLFQTGDTPAQQDFQDLVDTLFAGDAATAATAAGAVATANTALATAQSVSLVKCLARLNGSGATWTYPKAVGVSIAYYSKAFSNPDWITVFHVTFVDVNGDAAPLADANYQVNGDGTASAQTVDGFTYTIVASASNASYGFVVFD